MLRLRHPSVLQVSRQVDVRLRLVWERFLYDMLQLDDAALRLLWANLLRPL